MTESMDGGDEKKVYIVMIMVMTNDDDYNDKCTDN